MSDGEDDKLDLEKDDEDLEFSPPKEDSENSEKSNSTPVFCKTETGLLGDKTKHNVSFESSDSSYNDFSCYGHIKRKKFKKKIFTEKELTTLQKSLIKSQKENFDKEYSLLLSDFDLLQEQEKKIFKDTNLDIMFIMDLTGSMSMWLNEAKHSVNNIIEEITENNPGAKIRLSFIGYRDFNEPNEKRKYDCINFTENIDEYTKHLSKLECYGGGDEPEDVVGALNKALKMDWQSNAKYSILVCDAPCHGRHYHNVTYDKFENGDPDGFILETEIEKFMNMGITFYCIEINGSTKKMFDVMKYIYNDENKFHIEKLGNSVNQFSFFVAFSASVLLGNTKYEKIKFKNFLNNYRNEMIEKIVKKYSDKLGTKNDINIGKNNNLKNEGSNFSFSKNDNDISSQNDNFIDNNTLDLINQLENLDLEGNDKQLFDFINRMSGLNINNQNVNKKIQTNTNSTEESEEFISINMDINKIYPMSENNIIEYTLHGLTYNKDLNIINDWVNPNIIEQNLKTKILFSYNTLKYNTDNNKYEMMMYDFVLNKNFIGYIPSNINKKFYNNPKLYTEDLCTKELICEQIADFFNVKLHDELPQLKQYIKFKKHILYEMDSKSVEKLLIPENKNNYSKYIIADSTIYFDNTLTNPVDNQLLNVFSHFSYQISGGQLLIGEIKYDKIKKIVTTFNIFYLKNNGYKNILEFFASHICDNNCKKLGLIHPRKKNKGIVVEESFFSDKYLTETILCNCCSIPVAINNENSCPVCNTHINSSKRKKICSSCHANFEYNTYYYNCQLKDKPLNCTKCISLFG